MLIRTVGAIRRSPRVLALGWCRSSVERRLVVGAQERLGVPDPDGAEGPSGVVDQVGQRLRDRGPRHRGDEVVHLHRGPADVERAPYGSGGEAVDGRAAAGLDVGDQLQLPGQVGLQRAGRDGRQVGLEQHVVDRRRQQLVEAASGLRLVVGQQAPGVRRQPAERDQAESGRLGDRPRELVGAGAGPARPEPLDPLHQRRGAGAGGEHAAGLEVRRAGRAPSVGPRPGARWRARGPGRSTSCRPGPGSRPVPGAGGSPARRAPAPPSARRWAWRSTGRRHRSGSTRVAVRAGGGRQQPGGGRDLDQQGGGRLVDVQVAGGGPQIAYAEAAAAQRPGWSVPPLSSNSSIRRTTSKAAPAAARSTIVGATRRRSPARGYVDRLDGRAASAQRQPDLAGQHVGAATAWDQQPVGEQLLGRAAGFLGRDGVPGGAGRRGPAGVEDVLEQGPGRRRQRRRSGARPRQIAGGSVEIGRRPLTPGVPGRQGLGHGAHGPQSLGGLPRQREVQQPVERRSSPTSGSALTMLSESGRAGLTDDDEGIKDAELAPGQLVERAQYR